MTSHIEQERGTATLAFKAGSWLHDLRLAGAAATVAASGRLLIGIDTLGCDPPAVIALIHEAKADTCLTDAISIELRRQDVAQTAPFDAQAWLQALADIGGGWALTSGGQLTFLVARCDGANLERVMTGLVGYPGYRDRLAAIRSLIARRQCGEVL